MTAYEVYNIALALLDETSGSYDAVALPIINLIQNEIAKLEGVVPTQLTSLDGNLSISDDYAQRIMPFGVAAQFAIIDGMGDHYQHNMMKYQTGLRSVAATETPIKDTMGALAGL